MGNCKQLFNSGFLTEILLLLYRNNELSKLFTRGKNATGQYNCEPDMETEVYP